MALDLVVLGENGAPVKTVSLGPDLHHALMEAAEAKGFARFKVFADYYGDVEIQTADLADLENDACALRHSNISGELESLLERIGDLVRFAMTKNATLHALAD